MPGMQICHHCDIRTCMNPAHLFEGTYHDNMRDARHKNRMGKKLKGDKMVMALSMLASGLHSYAKIGRAVGVSSDAIRNLEVRLERLKEEKKIFSRVH